jgi:hypothetical protein
MILQNLFTKIEKHQLGASTTLIWIVNGNGLVFVGKVLDYTFCEDIKGPSQEDVICWQLNNVNL